MAQFSIFREQIGQIIDHGTRSTLARECLESNYYNADWTNLCYYKSGTQWEGSNFDDVSQNIYQESLNNMATTYGTDTNIYFGNIWGNILVSAYKTNAGPHADFNLQDISDVQLSFANIANDKWSGNDDTLSQYRENKKKRTELDLKMQELYEFGENDRQIMFDNSVYTTLAWTVLATSVLYYLFVKL